MANTDPSYTPPSVQNHSPQPPGILPRNAQAWVLGGIALVMVLVIAFSGYELAFYGLICVFGLVALWEFYGMLDHKGLPNFKNKSTGCRTPSFSPLLTSRRFS